MSKPHVTGAGAVNSAHTILFPARPHRHRRWPLLLILLLAFFFRAYALVENPPGLSGDEGIEGSDALSIGLDHLPLYFPANYGREPLYMYLLALSFKLSGVSTFTLRYPGVLCGILTLALTYTLLKRLWNHRVGRLTVSLLAVSFWPVFTGRLGLRAVTMPALQILAVYAMWRGLAESRRRWWLLTGVCLGAGLYTYIPARIFPALPLLWVILSAALGTAEWRARLWRNRAGFLLAALVGVIVFAPLGQFMLRHPDVVNQRLEGVGGPLQALVRGDLAPVLDNLSAVAGMVTFRGDPLPRYNIPGRPVPEWPLGLLWYAGLLLSLRRWREPRVNLLLLWGGLMISPTLLSETAPSFLRAIGALMPFYALPALAITHLAAKMTPRWRTVGALVIGLTFTLHAWGTWNDYFVKWPAYPGVTEIYGDRLVQLGHHLDTLLPLPPESQAIVVCYYTTDVCRDMLRMQTHYRGPLRAVTGYNALVLPAQPPGGDLVYLFGHALPLAPEATGVLQGAEVDVLERSAAGEPQTAVYHLRAAARAAPETGDRPLGGAFQGTLTLVGSTLPTDIPRGETRTGLLYWRTPDSGAPTTEALRWSLALVDEDGNTWDAVGDALPYPPQAWQPGDLVAQTLSLAMPVDAPPGPFTVTFGLFAADRLLIYNEPSGESHWDAALGVVQATGQPASVPVADTDAPSAGGIALTRAEPRANVAPGEPLNTTLYWRTLTTPRADYAVAFSLRQGDCALTGEEVFTAFSALWTERYPTSRW